MNSDHLFTLKSAVNSIVWPALPSLNASNLLAMQYLLGQSQWLTPEEIKDKQLHQLSEILYYARRNVPFYRKQFKRLFKAHTKIDWDLWHDLPILTRSDIQDQGKNILSTLIPKEHGKTSEVSTSGSTGKPVTVWQTELTSFFWRVFTLREHLWHHRDFSGKLAAIRYIADPQGQSSNGKKFTGWGPATKSIVTTGPLMCAEHPN